ncbi:MAG: DUF4302 domain-containing protein [Tunicatimonas sp.]
MISLLLSVAIGACRNNDEELIFDKTADERVAEATANLRQKLAAPANGWIMRYQPVPESGTYNVLLNFDADGGVRIRTDFGVNDNEFYDQVNTYRVDNSLGLELIFESYSFFSYLFEQNGATFEAEYEFVYVNETPNGELVFGSKTDLTSLTIAVLEPAPDNPENLLGQEINGNLETLSATLGMVSPVYRLNYANRDLSLYLSLNTNLRTISFTYVSSLSGEDGRPVTFVTGYTAQGNSLLLDEPLTLIFQGGEVVVPSIELNQLTPATLTACGGNIAINQYTGSVEAAPVSLLPTLFDPNGAGFNDSASFFFAGPQDIFNDGVPVGTRLREDVDGAVALQLYYFDREEDPFIALGFVLLGGNDQVTFALKDFTPTLSDNQIALEFAPDYTLYGDTTATVNAPAMDVYLNNLTSGGNTYILKSATGVYEFVNPCSKWSVVFRAGN